MIEHRLAEEAVTALLLDLQQAALDRAYRRPTRRCRTRSDLRRVVADELHHGAQVLEVEQQQAVVVGDLEDDRKHALLRFIEPEQARQQQKAPCRRQSADRVALLTPDVPQRDRARAHCRLRRWCSSRRFFILSLRAPLGNTVRSPFTSA